MIADADVDVGAGTVAAGTGDAGAGAGGGAAVAAAASAVAPVVQQLLAGIVGLASCLMATSSYEFALFSSLLTAAQTVFWSQSESVIFEVRTE